MNRCKSLSLIRSSIIASIFGLFLLCCSSIFLNSLAVTAPAIVKYGWYANNIWPWNSVALCCWMAVIYWSMIWSSSHPILINDHHYTLWYTLYWPMVKDIMINDTIIITPYIDQWSLSHTILINGQTYNDQWYNHHHTLYRSMVTLHTMLINDTHYIDQWSKI